MATNHDQDDPLRWVKRAVAAAAVVIGWVFIAWQNNFHTTAPVVFVCLAYLAVVGVIYNLWRTGASAVGGDHPGAEPDDSTWGKPTGVTGELEREKRTLLKAIKEAEFDLEMGKLSKHDAEEMIATYRARAIEVIKELERLRGHGVEGKTAREQIEAEVRARLEVVVKPAKKAAAEKVAAEKASKKTKSKDKKKGKEASP